MFSKNFLNVGSFCSFFIVLVVDLQKRGARSNLKLIRLTNPRIKRPPTWFLISMGLSHQKRSLLQSHKDKAYGTLLPGIWSRLI